MMALAIIHIALCFRDFHLQILLYITVCGVETVWFTALCSPVNTPILTDKPKQVGTSSEWLC
jgi:hypothetical protein